jgi:hypothetical protein
VPKSDDGLEVSGHDCAVPDDLRAITPEAARREADTVQDADLPMLAALWLADGYDSAQLRDLAGLTKRDGAEARALLPDMLVSLGYPIPTSSILTTGSRGGGTGAGSGGRSVAWTGCWRRMPPRK